MPSVSDALWEILPPTVVGCVTKLVDPVPPMAGLMFDEGKNLFSLSRQWRDSRHTRWPKARCSGGTEWKKPYECEGRVSLRERFRMQLRRGA